MALDPITEGNLDASNNQLDVSQLVTVLNSANQNMSLLIQTLKTQFPTQGAVNSYLSAAYSATGGTLIKSGEGFLISASVTTASTSATSTYFYDTNSAATAASSNIMAIVPSSGAATFGYPFTSGLVVQASSVSSHRVSVYYI